MPEKIESITPKEEELESARSANFLKLYANSVQIEANPFDFRMTFGEMAKSGSGKVAVEQLVSIIMSPHHAKAFLGVLASNLREYEKQVGVINLPAPLQGPAEAEKQASKTPDKSSERQH